MKNDTSFYQESKAINAPSLLLSMGMATILAAIAGYVYSLVVTFNPIIYLTVVLCVFFGIGLGLLVRLTAHMSKNRNKRSQYLMAIYFGLVANYVQWVVYAAYAVSQQTPLPNIILGIPELFNPSILFSVIVQINEFGMWGIGDVPLEGIPLALIWISEFIIIMAGPVLAVHKTPIIPFSEVQNRWFPKYTLADLFSSTRGTANLTSDLMHDPLETLKGLGPGRANSFSRIHVYYFDREPEAYLTVEKVRINEKNQEDSDYTVVNLKITNEVAHEIMEAYPHKRERINVF